MATYTYQALNASGKTQKGTVEAASSEEAIQRIKAQGYYPTSVQASKDKKANAKDKSTKSDTPTKKKKKKGGGFAIGRVKPKYLTLFTRQLSTLQDAGLPLLRSLQILESQQKPGLMKNVLLGVCEEVEGGSSLSEAMGKFPKAFDHLFVKMVNAGEIGGVLDVILQRLSEFMEKSQKLKAKIKGAMVYPIVVVVVAIAILTGIMLLIIPKFEEIFTDFEIELPGLTQGLITTSRWVAGSNPGQEIAGWYYLVFGIPVLWIAFKILRRTPPGKAVLDHLVLWTPVVGKLVRKTIIARFTRTMGTLISAGVPILEAVTITSQTSGNYVFEKALMNVHDSIREGESFAVPLRESKTCDPIVVNMIDVGEETGEMDAMLLKIADNYDEEVDVAVAALVSLLEPIMVVVLGVMVGTIVVAMFLPMIKMLESLSG
jgi:type IV pilus assembly protein PilC